MADPQNGGIPHARPADGRMLPHRHSRSPAHSRDEHGVLRHHDRAFSRMQRLYAALGACRHAALRQIDDRFSMPLEKRSIGGVALLFGQTPDRTGEQLHPGRIGLRLSRVSPGEQPCGTLLARFRQLRMKHARSHESGIGGAKHLPVEPRIRSRLSLFREGLMTHRTQVNPLSSASAVSIECRLIDGGLPFFGIPNAGRSMPGGKRQPSHRRPNPSGYLTLGNARLR